MSVPSVVLHGYVKNVLRWKSTIAIDRGQLRTASAQIQQIIHEAQADRKAAEEARRMLAVSEAERQTMTQKVETCHCGKCAETDVAR
eukprot:4757494-Pyramimonas_sp.AAC.1